MLDFTKKLRVSFYLMTILITGQLRAQNGKTIRSDRPGRAIGAFVVGHQVFQQQLGWDYNSYEIKDGMTSFRRFGLSSVFRYGATDRFELGLRIAFHSQKSEEPNGFGSGLSGFSSFSIRMRSNVYVGKGWVPSIGYQINLVLPGLNKFIIIDHIAPKLTIMTHQNLGDKFSLVTNFGPVWDGISPEAQGFYVVNLGYSLSNDIGVFIENYRTFDDLSFIIKWDAGVSWLVNRDFQLDLFGGRRSTGSEEEWFISPGISWRFAFPRNRLNVLE